MTIREVLEDKIQDILYSNMFEKDGDMMGHYETTDKILAVIAEIVRGEKIPDRPYTSQDCVYRCEECDKYYNKAIDHIASLFEAKD